MNDTRAIVNEIMGWIWNILLFVTITYYVFERDQSGWWYLLVLAFGAGRRNKAKEEE